MESKLSEMMQSAMNSVKRLVEVNNIIGEPINTADGLTLVPISKVSFGFGGAGGRLPGNNKAVRPALKLSPSVFLPSKRAECA